MTLIVPFGGKVLFKQLVCKDAGLRKTIHPLSNLNVHPAIRSDNVTKAVMEDDFVRDDIKTEIMYLGFSMGVLR